MSVEVRMKVDVLVSARAREQPGDAFTISPIGVTDDKSLLVADAAIDHGCVIRTRAGAADRSTVASPHGSRTVSSPPDESLGSRSGS
jgi:hypothetical protein